MTDIPANSTDTMRSEGTVLVIDDTATDLRIMEELLTKNGYQVRPSPNVDLAFKYLETDLPDLILLDIKMPGMDGYEICEVLKSEERTWQIPVIFISALDDTLDKVRGFDSGAVDYITKPYQSEEALVRIRTHIDLRRMQLVVEKQNQMLKREINERRIIEAEMQQSNELLEMRVLERTATIAGEKEAAEMANLVKNYFLQRISDELRNPVHGILTLAHDMGLRQNGMDEEQKAFIEKMVEKGDHLLSLIEDVNELSRFDAGNMDLDLRTVKLRELLESSLAIISQKKRDADVEFDLLITGELEDVKILVDDRKLRQILFNLLFNAVKFSPNGGRIILEAMEQDRSLMISVSDSGIGIDPEDQELIFLDSCKPSGPGWGLAITRRLVELHGGTIGVHSAGKGKGSRFTVTLPLHYM